MKERARPRRGALLRRLRALVVLGSWVVALPAWAQEPTDEPGPDAPKPVDASTEPAAPSEPTAEPSSSATTPDATGKESESPEVSVTKIAAPPTETKPVEHKER